MISLKHVVMLIDNINQYLSIYTSLYYSNLDNYLFIGGTYIRMIEISPNGILYKSDELAIGAG